MNDLSVCVAGDRFTGNVVDGVLECCSVLSVVSSRSGDGEVPSQHHGWCCEVSCGSRWYVEILHELFVDRGVVFEGDCNQDNQQSQNPQ